LKNGLACSASRFQKLATSVRRYAMSTDTLAVVAAFNAAWSAHDLDATLA